MKVAIMQPYFLPYIGYWQLLNAVDVFVVYDNIKYTKKGWINRNRFLLNNAPEVFTLPLKSGADDLDINQRMLAANFDRTKMVRQFENAYRKAIHSEEIKIIKQCVEDKSDNLFDFIFNSIKTVATELQINTEIIRSSSLPFDHKMLKSQDKVLAICNHFGANQYINPIGGTELYVHDDFIKQNIELKFLQSRMVPYTQSKIGEFTPWLSIADILLNVGTENAKKMLTEYDLV